MLARQAAHVVTRRNGRRAQRDVDCHAAALAHHVEARGVADALGHQAIADGAVVHDLVAVDLDDDVARLEARLRRRSAARNGTDEGTRHALEAERLGEFTRDAIELGTEPGPLDLAARDGALDVELHEVGGNGEADAVGAAGAREDGRVDAHHLARHIDEGATGVAGIDGGVGLNEHLRA